MGKVKNKCTNVTIKFDNILNIDFNNLNFDCFIFNGPLYKKEHQRDFEKLTSEPSPEGFTMEFK